MSDIEITVPIDYTHTMIVSTSGDLINLGYKKFKDIGEFKYHWTHEHMNRDDVRELINCIELAITLMDEPV